MLWIETKVKWVSDFDSLLLDQVKAYYCCANLLAQEVHFCVRELYVFLPSRSVTWWCDKVFDKQKVLYRSLDCASIRSKLDFLMERYGVVGVEVKRILEVDTWEHSNDWGLIYSPFVSPSMSSQRKQLVANSSAIAVEEVVHLSTLYQIHIRTSSIDVKSKHLSMPRRGMNLLWRSGYHNVVAS